jgi:ribosomal protein S18 acetylase RimI-like enzyme
MIFSQPTWGTAMSDYCIRRANTDDAIAIAAFNQAMALETEHKHLSDEIIGKGVSRMLASPDLGFYLVATSTASDMPADIASPSGDVVGCLGVTTEWSDWRNGLFWWIQSVYVAPDHRKHGVFSAMYAKVKALATAEPDVCGLRLYVETDNLNAQGTYYRLGMVKTAYYLLEEEF